MSACSSGVEISFSTPGDVVSFECRRDFHLKVFLDGLWALAKSKLTRDKELVKPVDGFDLLVDGELKGFLPPKNGRLEFEFSNEGESPVDVRILFPAISGVKIRGLEVNAAVDGQSEEKEWILCLGDSVTQGMIAVNPSLNYVARLSAKLNVDALNQAVGGFEYRASSLEGLQEIPAPKLITVAFGSNDWAFNPDLEDIRRNVEEYYAKLTTLFPGVPVYAITPLWRGDLEAGAKCGALSDVAACIETACNKYPSITVVDGLELIPHDTSYFADGVLHPNAKGFEVMADNLLPYFA
jgi:lysophospholipase L1-like esterase